MKDTHERTDLALAPRDERAILDEIRNDRDLIARLKITPKELEALSKCALLGTLTCKQDMLFILRQIREATTPAIDDANVFAQPAMVEEPEEDPIPDFRRLPLRPAANTVIPAPGSFDSVASRRLTEQFGILFWAVILVAGLIWNAYIIMSHMRDNLIPTAAANTIAQAPAPATAAWFDNLDHFNVLMGWEILFVVVLAAGYYLKTQKASRRFKVRPGGSRSR
jgi:hypothetical protein